MWPINELDANMSALVSYYSAFEDYFVFGDQQRKLNRQCCRASQLQQSTGICHVFNKAMQRRFSSRIDQAALPSLVSRLATTFVYSKIKCSAHTFVHSKSQKHEQPTREGIANSSKRAPKFDAKFRRIAATWSSRLARSIQRIRSSSRSNEK